MNKKANNLSESRAWCNIFWKETLKSRYCIRRIEKKEREIERMKRKENYKERWWKYRTKEWRKRRGWEWMRSKDRKKWGPGGKRVGGRKRKVLEKIQDGGE